MAINDAATLVIGAGNFFTSPVDTPMPVDLTSITTPWENIGNTSLEDILSISSDGGEATTLGTLQNKSLRTKYSPRTEAFGIALQQFDAAGLKLYFGSNAEVLADGSIGVPQDPIPTTVAFLAVFIDATNVFAFYAPKAEIFRGDDMSLSDTESLASLPLSVKPLISGTNTWAYAVTPLGAA